MHPASGLLIWLLAVLLIQNLKGGLLVAVLLGVLSFGGLALQRCGRLAWSARWLFLSLFVIIAWGSAGEPVWSGVLAPSREGLVDALTQVGRLLLVLLVVATLRERMPVPELLSGMRCLLKPLRRLGVDPDRGLVRLLLVLRYLETLPRPRDWRNLLDVTTGSSSEVFEIADRPFSWPDYLVVLLVAGSVVAVCIRQA
ncbi:CbiQ family ECF transporter T component [Accumulibacter sp.]|uniref:CbiQ family ECF transporter T component n=1 Tax=Accumulibacter sp. TaxID=2053492 RepID=UPI002633593D|nr:CbiQ family ECF transporter T component [Accumulibacter sp.]